MSCKKICKQNCNKPDCNKSCKTQKCCDAKCCNIKCYPELTGKSKSPLGIQDNEKNFAAGNFFSSNAVYDNETFTKETIGGLSTKYNFEIIPDTQEVRDAGYNDTDRANAEVWYGPTADKKRFYYTAFTGSPLFPSKSSILVCREIHDGTLVYAVDCGKFNLDTAPNFIGFSGILCRIAPAIYKKTLYIGSVSITNIGPQLYAINKKTGELKWALAYYTPTGIPISIKGNYAQYTGSNMAISDLNIVVKQFCGECHPTVLCGISSLQNTPFNVGLLGGSYAKWTDQGFLFKIKDTGCSGNLVAKIPSCPPLLKTGDTVSNIGPDSNNPFMPSLSYTVIGTVASNTVINPYFFVANDPYLRLPPAPASTNTSPVLALISFNQNTTIDMSLFTQDVWTLAIDIYQDLDRTTAYTKAQLINLWTIEQQAPGFTSVTHSIWSYLSQPDMTTVTGQSNNGGLFYFKTINSGSVIANDYDAQALNYYGNSVWGAPPSIDCENIYFGTGQNHAMPFFEAYYYSDPARDFIAKKVPLVEKINDYVEGNALIGEVNNEKDKFLQEMRDLTFNLPRSPRNIMNYPDSIMATTGNKNSILFASRTIPHDLFVFTTNDPISVLIGPLSIADGDASSGIHIFNTGRKKIATSAKHGLGLVFDIEDLDKNVTFNGSNLEEKGVFLTVYQYLGPNGVLGGSNFMSTQTTGKFYITCQNNVPSLFPIPNGPGFDLKPELFVTRDGEKYDLYDSFMCALNVDSGYVEWNSNLRATANAEPGVVNSIVLTADINGTVYAHDAFNGKELWKYDLTKQEFPTFGGISSACVLDNSIIWIPAYLLPIVPEGIVQQGSKYGVALHVNKKNLLCPDNLIDNLVGKKYCYKDTTNNIEIIMKWENDCVKVHYKNGDICTHDIFKIDSHHKKNECCVLSCEETLPKIVFKHKSHKNSCPQLTISNLNVFSKVSYTIDVKFDNNQENYLFTACC